MIRFITCFHLSSILITLFILIQYVLQPYCTWIMLGSFKHFQYVTNVVQIDLFFNSWHILIQFSNNTLKKLVPALYKILYGHSVDVRIDSYVFFISLSNYFSFYDASPTWSIIRNINKRKQQMTKKIVRQILISIEIRTHSTTTGYNT